MSTERAPLAGRRIVLTRSSDDNRSLVVALGELGASTVEVPLVGVLAPDDGGLALDRAVARITEYRWVVLTSANGALAVRRSLGDRPWPDGVTVVPVGPATAAAARSAGMAVGPAPSSATARNLVEEFEVWDGVDGRRVLAPLAELAGSTVVDGLTTKGYLVDRVTAYRTDAPEDPSTCGDRDRGSSGAASADGPAGQVAGADAVTFFSPSAVDRFVERFGRGRQAMIPGRSPMVIVCIGPSTSARATVHGFDDVITADPHTEAGVVTAVASVLATG